MVAETARVECQVSVGLVERKLTVEKVVDKRTGQTEKRRVRIVSVEIEIQAPFGRLAFRSTKTHHGWGSWRDEREVRSARRSKHDSWGDVFETLRRFTTVDSAVSAILQAKGLMV